MGLVIAQMSILKIMFDGCDTADTSSMSSLSRWKNQVWMVSVQILFKNINDQLFLLFASLAAIASTHSLYTSIGSLRPREYFEFK